MVEDRPSGYAGRDHNSFLAKNGICAVESRINNGSLNSKTEEKITFHNITLKITFSCFMRNLTGLPQLVLSLLVPFKESPLFSIWHHQQDACTEA